MKTLHFLDRDEMVIVLKREEVQALVDQIKYHYSPEWPEMGKLGEKLDQLLSEGLVAN